MVRRNRYENMHIKRLKGIPRLHDEDSFSDISADTLGESLKAFTVKGKGREILNLNTEKVR